MKTLLCDYLIIGSGAAPLAFLDTLFEEMPDKKVILVDKKARPGGHWVDGYDFVHLHQPSVVYGIASKQLEGNWAKLMLTRFMLPWNHRANKKELLDYFQEFVDSNTASGRLQYFPGCVYDFEQNIDAKNASFTSLDGEVRYNVEIRDKLINGINGECIIPSLSPPAFHVDKGINLMTPNQIFDLQQRESMKNEGVLSTLRHACGYGKTKDRHFVVMGAGKTAMDTVVFLQSDLGVPPSAISWVISNDVWMLSRGNSNPSAFAKALLKNDNDKDKACLALEAKGQFVRLDPEVLPTRFRFPVVGNDEIEVMRNVRNKIRRGRISSIRKDGGGVITVAFEKGNDLVLANSEGKEHIFVHCTSPGPFNDKTSDEDEVFRSEQEIALDYLYAPPVSISMSSIAKLESARQNGTLDIEFGRKLLKNNTASPNDVLRFLIKGDLRPNSEKSFLDEMRALITQAIFISILDKDPMVGYKWLKTNRLSLFSIPGAKVGAVKSLELIVEKGKNLGSAPGQLEMLQKVAGKLEPLRGM